EKIRIRCTSDPHGRWFGIQHCTSGCSCRVVDLQSVPL
ncbi:hypothetical protein, partial [Pseudomonas fluorescens]